MTGQTFLSYSRQHYYFAESLALHLQQRGLSVWFDMQQLEPGVNWAVDIEDGLTRSTSMTLVASRAALSSPYVEREWRHALDTGKPVVIALYERTRLPDDLRRRAVVVDFRGSFEHSLQALDDHLQHPQPPDGPARTLLRLPRLPAGVRQMALALFLDDVRLLLGFLIAFFGIAVRVLAADSAPRVLLARILGDRWEVAITPATPWLLVAIGGLLTFRYLLQYRRRFKAAFFLSHDFSYEATVSQLAIKTEWLKVMQVWLFLFGLTYAAAAVLQGGLQSVADVLLANTWLFGLLLLLVFRELLVYVIRSTMPACPHPDIVRWAKLGQVPQAWRVQVNQALVQTNRPLIPDEQVQQMAVVGRPLPAGPSTAVSAVRTYRIVYEPGDDRAAEEVRRALQQIDYYPASSDKPSARTVLLLSYRTPLSMARDCLQTQSGLISVLVTDIRLPDDLPELTRQQLVDYRQQDNAELLAAFSYLDRDDEASRSSFSLKLLPVNLASNVGSRALQMLSTPLFILGGINLIYVAYFVVRLWLFSIPILPIPAIFLPQAAGGAALLLISLLLAWFAFGVLRGVARFPVRLLVMIAAIPLLIFLLIEGSAPLAAQISVVVPQTEWINNPLNGRPVGVILVAYVLALWMLVRSLSHKYLLVRPGIPVLGMRRMRLQWQVILAALFFILVIMALSLVESN